VAFQPRLEAARDPIADRDLRPVAAVVDWNNPGVRRMPAIPIFSFFTGGGFLDLGLEQAGFSVVWTNENNPAFADMYESAMTAWRKSQKWAAAPAKVSSRSSIVDLDARAVLREGLENCQAALFGVVGGPPCPDFSSGGKHAGAGGENGRLTRTFTEMILRMRPHFFLMENVSGLWKFRKHRRFLNSQVSMLREGGNYAIDLKVLDALELGIPQSRERLFVVGIRKGIANRALGRKLSAKETGWFPWPRIERYAAARSLPWPTTDPFGGSPARPAEIPIELTAYQPLLGDGDPEALPNGREYFHSYSEKFWQRREGDVSSKSFKRLHRYRYSPTVWYGNQEVHLHPWKPRRLSVREALRIQSVPDEYVLPESFSLSAKFKMICNGVPSRMAELVGAQLRLFLEAGAPAGSR